jgi:hypothetical protein
MTTRRAHWLLALLVFSILPGRWAAADIYDVIDMAKAGTPEDALLAFVQKSPDTYDLSADDIKYLYDVGVPDSVVLAMLDRPAEASAVAYARKELNDDRVGDYAALNTAPAAEVNDEGQFYEALSPYGTWLDIDAYGSAWQPYATLIDADWAPYRDRGRMIFADNAGWTWYSDYSWGWAPFHYGRWVRVPAHRWCWVPDVTWAPAWVAWRGTDDYYGWAPLPPEAYWEPGIGFSYFGRRVGFDFDFGLGPFDFFFLSSRDFGCWHCAPFFCDPWLRPGIFGRSLGFVGLGFGDGGFAVFNFGFDFDDVVRHRPHHSMQRWHLADARLGSGGRIHSDFAEGNQFFLHRPEVRAGARLTALEVQKGVNERLARIESRREVRLVNTELRQGRITDPAALRLAKETAQDRHDGAAKLSKQFDLATRAEARQERRAELARALPLHSAELKHLATEEQKAEQTRLAAAGARREALLAGTAAERDKRLADAELKRESVSAAKEKRLNAEQLREEKRGAVLNEAARLHSAVYAGRPVPKGAAAEVPEKVSVPRDELKQLQEQRQREIVQRRLETQQRLETQRAEHQAEFDAQRRLQTEKTQREVQIESPRRVLEQPHEPLRSERHIEEAAPPVREYTPRETPRTVEPRAVESRGESGYRGGGGSTRGGSRGEDDGDIPGRSGRGR